MVVDIKLPLSTRAGVVQARIPPTDGLDAGPVVCRWGSFHRFLSKGYSRCVGFY